LANRIRAWVPAAAWAAFLFVLSSLPALPGPSRLPFGDKLGHFVLYGVFGLLLAWGRARSGRPVAHALLLLTGALYGVSDEWHQLYVPGRVPDAVDWLADVAGLVTGYAAGTTFLNRAHETDREDSA
jgi:VanZ family protein